jgi:hypothetical protein
MPQKHELPGSNPGWGTRIFLRRPRAFACSFTTWMWQRRPAARADASCQSRSRGGAGRAFARSKCRYSSTGQSETSPASGCEFKPRCLLHRSRRLKVRTAAFQAVNAGSIPAGNAIQSRCSAAGQRASFGTRRPQVRILPARPIDSPVAQRTAERAATNREDEGSNPSWGARCAARLLARRTLFHGAVTQVNRVPACRAGSRGFKSRRCRQSRTARSSIARAAGSYPAGCRFKSCRADQLAMLG